MDKPTISDEEIVKKAHQLLMGSVYDEIVDTVQNIIEDEIGQYNNTDSKNRIYSKVDYYFKMLNTEQKVYQYHIDYMITASAFDEFLKIQYVTSPNDDVVILNLRVN